MILEQKKMATRCKYKNTSQKPCQIVMKIGNFFTFFFTFKSYVNDSKLCWMINMKVEEFKLEKLLN